MLDLVTFAPTSPDNLLMHCEDSLLVFGNRNLNRNDRKSVWKRSKASKADKLQQGSVQATRGP